MSIHNRKPLLTVLAAAASSRVPVMVYSDSNTYTNGGWQMALSLALRGIQPLFASPVVGSGQSGFAQGIEPRISANSNGDTYWSVSGGGMMFNNTSAAPSAQLAIFSGLPNRTGEYLADGVSPTNNRYILGLSRWSGLNIQEALRFHVWDGTFASGTGKWSYNYRLEASPFTTYLSQAVNSNTGSVGRRHSTADLAASGSRAIGSVGYHMRTNNAGDVGPVYVYGQAVEAVNRTSGFNVQSALSTGGNSSANNIDFLRPGNSRNSHVELWRMVGELVGTPGYCLCIVNYGLNDRNDAGASHRYSGNATGGSSTTIVLDDTSGVDHTGSTITFFPEATGTRETKTISSYNVGTKTATISGTFSATPASGDFWRIGPLTNTGDGYKYNHQRLIDIIRADCATIGFTPIILLVPAWRDSASVNSAQDAFDAAAIQLAADNPADTTAVDTDTLFPISWITRQAYVDGTHPGGYVLAAMFNAIVTEAARLGTYAAPPSQIGIGI